MAKRALSFTGIVGDEEEFFRTYFNRRVLYRPGGITGDPRQIQDILHNGPEFWDTPYLDDASPEEMVSKIEQLIGRLRTADAAAELERARRGGRSFRGVRQDALFQEMAAADSIDADTKLLAVDGATTFHETADGTAKVTILGNTVAMPEATAAAPRSASTAVPFPAAEFLAGADSRRALQVARQLLRLGALRIAG
jgi:hypothetical protein